MSVYLSGGKPQAYGYPYYITNASSASGASASAGAETIEPETCDASVPPNASDGILTADEVYDALMERGYYGSATCFPNLPDTDVATGFECQPYPSSANHSFSYTVKPGDNLTKIARALCSQYGCINPDIQGFINYLVDVNNIKNRNLIYPGQVLVF